MSTTVQILNPTREVIETVSTEPRHEIVQVLTSGIRGPRGLPGDAALELTKIADEDLGGHRVVTVLPSGRVGYSDPTDINHAGRVIGFTTHACSQFDEIQIVHIGEVVEPTWNLTISEPLFLLPNGTFGPTPDPSGVFVQIIGFSTGTDSIFINIHQPIILS